MKTKIRAYLPVGASAEFEIDKPENWDNLSHKKKVKTFLESEDLNAVGYICHHCSRHLSTDLEVFDSQVDEKYITFDEVKER